MTPGSWRARRESKGLWKFKFLSGLSTGILIIVVVFLLMLFISVIFFATQIPNPSDLSNRDIAAATKIYDKSGQLLYDIYQDQNRTPVKLVDIPDYVKEATISIEDKDFYKHGGFSIIGITRSLFDLIVYKRVEGGSTLTQQLVKNALLSGERTVTRKLKEFILAVQVERTYKKDQILEMYLNEIPYGGTAYGIEAAANLYFGKSAKDLDLAQAALLAGLPQRPSVYSPYGTHPELAKARQKEVLNRMVDDKYITEDQAKAAEDEELTYRTGKSEQGFKAPHFVLYVKEKLIEQFGDKMVEGGGLKVTTTLDYDLQKKAEEIVKKEVDNLQSAKVGNGAAVVLDPKSGQILVLVGSKDYFGKSLPEDCKEGATCSFEPNVDVAISLRQPGSATKPIAYSKALQKGYSAGQVYMDVKTEFPGGGNQPNYNPVNYDGQFHGPVQMRYALGNSFNIPAVKNLAMVGVKDVLDLGYQMGLTTWEPSDENVASVGLSLVLGGREVRLLDLTSAYSVFANQGRQLDPVSILKVTDSKGKILFEYHQPDGKKVLDPGIAFIISDILADNGARTAAFGSNSVLNISGKTVAVKTGTTDQKRDNWAVGYTPSVVVGAWVGNNNNAEMSAVVASGVTGASPIWNKIMSAALQGKANEGFAKPDDVIQTEIDGLVTGKPHGGSPTRKEYFVVGTEPKNESGAYQHRKVCKSNPHRLANDNEDNEEKDVVVLQENDPTGADKWQKGIDEWVITAADPKLVGATQGCSGVPGFTAGTGGVIEIVNVGNGANVPRVFDVLAKANSGAGVKKITWLVDGAQKSTQTAEPYALHVEFPQGDKGSHTITVTLEDNNGGTFNHSIGVTVAL